MLGTTSLNIPPPRRVIHSSRKALLVPAQIPVHCRLPKMMLKPWGSYYSLQTGSFQLRLQRTKEEKEYLPHALRYAKKLKK